MHRDPERLDQSCLVRRHSCGNGKEVAGGQVDQFTKKSRMLRGAEKLNVGAYVVLPAQAELAVVAVERGLEGPAVTRRQPGNIGTRSHDRSCRLMSEHHR